MGFRLNTFVSLLEILHCLKKRIKEENVKRQSIGQSSRATSPPRKRKIEDHNEASLIKKQEKRQSTGNIKREEEEAHSHDSVEASNQTIGGEEFRHLWNQIKDGLQRAASRYETEFYTNLKRFFAKQSDQNKGRVMLSDVEKMKVLLSRFDTTMTEFGNKKNDADDYLLYGSWIEEIISDVKKQLPLSE
jgi:hypothetical protein